MKQDAKDQIAEIMDDEPAVTVESQQQQAGENLEKPTTATPDKETVNPEISVKTEGSGDAKPGIPVKGQTDKWGNPFNPAYHAMDNEGHPKMNKTGPFAGYIGISKPKACPRPNENPPQSSVVIPGSQEPEPAPMEDPETVTLSSDVAGRLFAKIQFSIAKFIFGPEWDPKPKENEELSEAWQGYFDATGKCQDLSPGWIIVAVTADYAAQRMAMKETKTRMQKIMGKIKTGYGWMKWRFFNGAYPNARAYGIRENDTGKDVGTDAEEGR